MHGGPGRFAYIILAILLLIDIYAFRGLRNLSLNWNNSIKIVATVLYWIVPVFITIMVFYIMKNMSVLASGKLFYRTFYTFMGVMILFYVPKIIFSAFELANDVVNGLIFISNKTDLIRKLPSINTLKYVGAIVSLGIFLFTFYGIIYGRYQYKVNNVKLTFPSLPDKFNGFKIVQISDWHIGSYYNKPDKIEDVVRKINSLDPDILLFTGDLVNNVSSEVDEFIPSLKKLKAKYGKYSILGNHDYGDYVQWKSEDDKVANLNRLIGIEEEIGFTMLNNESTEIVMDDQKISLIGVENWGLPPFPQHGDLNLAMQKTDSIPFKILMSHDPSHWDEEVLKKTDINLTLSGHTHGMQFGFMLKNMKWSPVKYKYPRWAGLYKESGQKLYVNVGIGYIGFPGRVGIRPEITVFELHN